MSISFNLPTDPFLLAKGPHRPARSHDYEGKLLREEKQPARLAASWHMDAASAHLICEWKLTGLVASAAAFRRNSQ